LERVAWVTGAGSGIGRAIAVRLARAGWRVAASGRRPELLDAVAAEVDGITPFALDVTDRNSADRVAAAIRSELGPIDLALLNAGGSFMTTAENFSVENFRKTVDLNLMGTVNCMGAVVPAMVERHSGHIAIMGSQSAFNGLPNAAAYGASKAALYSMAEAYKPEFERHGVVITIINPGFVRTPMTEGAPFPMPFLMDLDDAADIIMRGLAQQRFAINFPWQMALTTRLLASLPYSAKFSILRRMLPPERR
jgi:NAD(P)-dependent dehydrogenase (short-subunit alcohol dehydrogenase family)